MQLEQQPERMHETFQKSDSDELYWKWMNVKIELSFYVFQALGRVPKGVVEEGEEQKTFPGEVLYPPHTWQADHQCRLC